MAPPPTTQGFTVLNRFGITYYLNLTYKPDGTPLYFFAKQPTNPVELPDCYELSEARSGLPLLKRWH